MKKIGGDRSPRSTAFRMYDDTFMIQGGSNLYRENWSVVCSLSAVYTYCTGFKEFCSCECGSMERRHPCIALYQYWYQVLRIFIVLGISLEIRVNIKVEFDSLNWILREFLHYPVNFVKVCKSMIENFDIIKISLPMIFQGLPLIRYDYIPVINLIIALFY